MLKTAHRLFASAAATGTLFLASVAFADQAAPVAPVSSQAQAAATDAAKGPALWVVRDEDSTIYLFGSFHFLKPDLNWQQDHVDAAFASADEIWFEATDIDDAAQAQSLIRQYGLSPEKPLSSYLPAESNEKLQGVLAGLGMPGNALENYRPWLASLNLAVLQLGVSGFDPNSGVDKILMAKAREQGKPLKGLESLAEQIRILEGVSDEAQAKALMESLDEMDTSADMLSSMLSAWSSGDVEALGHEMIDSMKLEQPEIYEALFTRRNANWTQQIKTVLEGSGTAFIVVGAGHLAGEDSVQNMLAAQGITSERVTH